MHPLLDVALRNAGMAALLAVLAAVVGSVSSRPALKHSLWLLVLLKLITPPVVSIPISWPSLSVPSAKIDSSLDDNRDAIAWAEPMDDPEQNVDHLRPETDLRALAPPPAEDSPRPASPGTVDQPGDQLVPSDAHLAEQGGVEAEHASAPLSWSSIIALVWLAGSACWFAVSLIRIERFQRSLRCVGPAPERLRQQVEQLALRMGLSRCPTVWLAPGRISPLLWALGGPPRLFIPTVLWDRLNQDQRETLLAHELAHLRRGDHWVRGLELLVTGLYWWHPVVWWACRELWEAEERCCDAWVVWALPDSARAYATALVETVDFLSETQIALPASASGIGHVPDLRRRLTMIMRGTTPKALSWAGFLAVVGLAAFLLPIWPTAAQPPDRPTDPSSRLERPRNEARLAGALVLPRDDPNSDEPADGSQDRANAELKRAQAEVEQASAQLRAMQAQMEAATKRLQNMQRALYYRRIAGEEQPKPMARPTPVTKNPTAASSERLSDLDHKLDVVLEEVRSLRREIRRSRPDGGAPGMPGMRGPGGLPRVPSPPLEKPAAPGASLVPPTDPSSPIPPTPALAAPPAIPVPPANGPPGAAPLSTPPAVLNPVLPPGSPGPLPGAPVPAPAPAPKGPESPTPFPSDGLSTPR